jgi:3-hydroxybutyryl-CoA dehydratase
VPPPPIQRRLPAALTAGAVISFRRTLTEADAAAFIGATWDVNPYHTDETFAAATRFGRRIVPGLLTASLLTHLGGLYGFLATEMRFEFLAPVFAGDTVEAVAEVASTEPDGRLRLRCRCTNAAGKDVLRADVTGFPAGPRPS